jgi:hypothetical protein
MDVASQDDGSLVRTIAGGGALDAEAELCRRMRPRAQLYGLRHLRDEQRACDLAQSAILTLLLAARSGRVEDPDRVDRFMLGTCRNLARRMREAEARAEPVDPSRSIWAWRRRSSSAWTRALSAIVSLASGRAHS